MATATQEAPPPNEHQTCLLCNPQGVRHCWHNTLDKNIRWMGARAKQQGAAPFSPLTPFFFLNHDCRGSVVHRALARNGSRFPPAAVARCGGVVGGCVGGRVYGWIVVVVVVVVVGGRGTCRAERP